MTDRTQVRRWLAGYESAWRAPGTGALADLFTSDASYLQSPYEQPVVGLAAIERMWDEERDGPGEVFRLATEILAVDGATAVVRAEVHYGDPPHQEYRDLWVIHLGDDGAAPGSRNGRSGPGTPTPPATTTHEKRTPWTPRPGYCGTSWTSSATKCWASWKAWTTSSCDGRCCRPDGIAWA